RNLRFGVREHAMGALVNGMALHGGVIPYGATFLIFSDYMRPAVRLAALMDVHSIFVFTHDSIGVGEDGPTHQPIEHLSSLRAMPNMILFRPADANETAAAWRVAVSKDKPICFALSRQNLPVLDPDSYPGVVEGAMKGAYVLSDAEGTPNLLLIATGSEVALALAAQEKLLADKGIKARVVSMPSWELFKEQPEDYRNQVLPPDVKARLAVEAGSPLGWCQWTGSQGDVIGIDHFGASAPGPEVMKRYGFTVENVVARAAALVGK
ncbi:MAG: transketolase C-terminal domain-containing protein, partial [Thermodesulfobacteriota bacterium]